MITGVEFVHFYAPNYWIALSALLVAVPAVEVFKMIVRYFK